MMQERSGEASDVFKHLIICFWTSIAVSVVWFGNARAIESMASTSMDPDETIEITTMHLPIYDVSAMIPEASSYPTRRPSALAEPTGFRIPKDSLVHFEYADAIPERIPWSTSGTVHIYPTKVPPRSKKPSVLSRGTYGDSYYLSGPSGRSPFKPTKFPGGSFQRTGSSGVPQSRNSYASHSTSPYLIRPLVDSMIRMKKHSSVPMLKRHRDTTMNKGRFGPPTPLPVSFNPPPFPANRDYSAVKVPAPPNYNSFSNTFMSNPQLPLHKFTAENQKLEKFSSATNTSLETDAIVQDGDDEPTTPSDAENSVVSEATAPASADAKAASAESVGFTESTVTKLTGTINDTSAGDLSVSLADEDDAGITGGAVAGIVIGALSSIALLAGIALFIMYKRPFGKSPHMDHPSQNNVYIDDTIHVGYLNHHIELPKESPEEMTSLDNDAFLNSLEAVTIQNYWADNTRNTKV